MIDNIPQSAWDIIGILTYISEAALMQLPKEPLPIRRALSLR
jgi:hypothetical protein